MDVTDLGAEGMRVHEVLTSELRSALESRDLAEVQALYDSWNAVHEGRRQRIRELKRAIQRAENHFKVAEADRLREELASLE